METRWRSGPSRKATESDVSGVDVVGFDVGKDRAGLRKNRRSRRKGQLLQR